MSAVFRARVADAAARLAAVIDAGAVAVERDGLALTIPTRFGVVAVDEGLSEEEQLPAALADRLALRIDLTALSHRDIESDSLCAADIAAACRIRSEERLEDPREIRGRDAGTRILDGHDS